MSQLRGDSSAAIQASFLERQKAKWKPDQLATHCDRCSQPFGLLRRKHHCRRCGGIFCDPCCAARVNLPGYGAESQRVCKICEAILFASSSTTTSGLNSVSGATSASPTSSLANNNNQQSGGGGLGGLMSKISGLGSTAPSQTGSPQAKKPLDGSTTSRNNNSTSASPQSIVSGLGNTNNASTTKTMMTTANLPSLELFPRERRILLIGSPGVGKGSFIATACGVGTSTTGNGNGGNNNNNNNNAPYNNNYNNINSTTSPNFGSARGNYSASNANFNNHNDPSSPANNNEKNQVFEGASSSSMSEKKRIIPFMGLLYQLVLVNTAGSTVSSELFVHPLLTIGTAGYILMYDVTEPKSFEVLGLLQERLLDCGAQDRAMILVGSKADHVSASGAGRERVVSKDQALKLANNWRVPHVDVSCTSKESVDVALMELLREIAARDTY